MAREHTREVGGGARMGGKGTMGAARAAPWYIDRGAAGAAAMVCTPVAAPGDWPAAACMASRRA